MRSHRLVLFGALLAILLTAAPVAAATGGGGGGGIVITVDLTGTLDRGAANISGTLTCSPLWTSLPAVVDANPYLTQPVGRLRSVSGGGSIRLSLDSCANPVAWQALVIPFSGKFAAGIAYVQVQAFGCDEAFNCDQGQTTAIVKLLRH